MAPIAMTASPGAGFDDESEDSFRQLEEECEAPTKLVAPSPGQPTGMSVFPGEKCLPLEASARAGAQQARKRPRSPSPRRLSVASSLSDTISTPAPLQRRLRRKRSRPDAELQPEETPTRTRRTLAGGIS